MYRRSSYPASPKVSAFTVIHTTIRVRGSGTDAGGFALVREKSQAGADRGSFSPLIVVVTFRRDIGDPRMLQKLLGFNTVHYFPGKS